MVPGKQEEYLANSVYFENLQDQGVSSFQFGARSYCSGLGSRYVYDLRTDSIRLNMYPTGAGKGHDTAVLGGWLGAEISSIDEAGIAASSDRSLNIYYVPKPCSLPRTQF